MLKKRIAAILLIVTMLVTFMPSMAFAVDENSGVAKPTLMGTSHLFLQASAKGKRAIKLSWSSNPAATKYVVYGNACGKSYKKLKTIKKSKKNKISYTVKKIGRTNLKAHRSYKFYVMVKMGSDNLMRSKTIHFFTAKYAGKYGNVTKVTAKKELNLDEGQKGKVNAKYKVYKNKKHMTKGHGAAIRYASSNNSVASVNGKGVVTANSEGTAVIYSQDIGGKLAKTKVVVNAHSDMPSVDFDIYKDLVKAKCDALLQLTDNDEVKKLIDKAKSDIDALKYDNNLSLEENKVLVDKIYNELLKNIELAREKYGPAPAPKEATFKAVFNSDDKSLTFYLDDKEHNGEGKVYDNLPVDASEAGSWGFNSKRADITHVVIDPTVQNVNFKSLAFMFSGMTNLKYIEGLTNISSDSSTNMESMFEDAGKGLEFDDELETLDLSKFNVTETTNTTNMFNNCKLTSFTLGSGWDKGLSECSASSEDMYYDSDATDDAQYSINIIDNNYITNNAITGNDTKTFSICILKAILKPIDTPEYINSNRSDQYYTLNYYYDKRKLSDCSADGKNIVYGTDQLKQVGSLNCKMFATDFNGELYEYEDHLNRINSVYKEKFNFDREYVLHSNADFLSFISQWGYNKAEYRSNILKVEIHKSMSNCNTIKSTAGMFAFLFNVNEWVGFEYLNTRNVTDMSGMFLGAGNEVKNYYSDFYQIINSPDSGNWDTHNVTNLDSIFAFYYNEYTIGESPKVSNWDTSNVTNMNSVFNLCQSTSYTIDIPDVSKWVTSKVIDMGELFADCCRFSGRLTGCKKTVDVSKWDTSNVENMYATFMGCSAQNCFLEEVPDVTKWKTDKVKDMRLMFSQYGEEAPLLNKVPNVADWNTASVKRMDQMFSSYNGRSATCFGETISTALYSLTEVPDVSNWDVSSADSMSYMFNQYAAFNKYFNKVPDVSKWDVSSCIDFSGMFFGYAMSSNLLNVVPNLSEWDTCNAKYFNMMFQWYGQESIHLSDFPNLNGEKFTTKNAVGLSYMFYGYGSSSSYLGTLDLSNFDTRNAKYFYDQDYDFAKEKELGYSDEDLESLLLDSTSILGGCTASNIILGKNWVNHQFGEDNNFNYFQYFDGYYMNKNKEIIKGKIEDENDEMPIPSGEGVYKRLIPIDGDIFYIDNSSFNTDNYIFFDEECNILNNEKLTYDEHGIPSSDSKFMNAKYYIKNENISSDSIYIYKNPEYYYSSSDSNELFWDTTGDASNLNDEIGCGKQNTYKMFLKSRPKFTINLVYNPLENQNFNIYTLETIDFLKFNKKIDSLWINLNNLIGYSNDYNVFVGTKSELDKLFIYINKYKDKFKDDDNLTFSKNPFKVNIWSSTESSSDSNKAMMWDSQQNTWVATTKDTKADYVPIWSF